MPLYEYKCERCGDVFEVIQKFSDAALQQHEGCGGHLEKLLSAAALQFKGTGWYVTDYAKGGSNGQDKAPSKSEAKDGSGTNGSSKSDSSKSDSSKSDSSKSDSPKPSTSTSSTASKSEKK